MEAQDLQEALCRPQEFAILKCKAHTKNDTLEAWGNAMADQMAREAASLLAIAGDQMHLFKLETPDRGRDLKEMQDNCLKEEKWP